MKPNPGIKRLALFVALPSVLVTVVVLGVVLTRRERPVAEAPRDAKAAIFQRLAKQTKQKQFDPPFDFELPEHVAMLRTNANALEQRAAEIRTALRSLESETDPLRKEVEAVRTETQRLKQAAAAAKVALKEAESRPQPDRDELARLQIDCETKSRAWILKREEIGPKEAQLAASMEERSAAMGRELRDLETKLQPIRDEQRAKEQELAGQENAFIRAVRQKVSETHSYEVLYLLIAQQVSAADRLLTGDDIERRRMGISFAREACRHALNEAVDPWLAARIAEVYLWPHLELADYTPASKERAQDVLHLCKSAFTQAEETKSIKRNYELMIAHAPNRHHADTSRLGLADLLEQTGDYSRAVQCLKEIQEASVLPLADPRLARIQQRVSPAP